jgi:Flp pilus assembly protein TadG
MRQQRRRSKARHAAGQSLVEFALVFPVLIILLIAIFDFGRLVFAYNAITNAAREGARVGIINQTEAGIQDEVMIQATSLGLAAGDVDVTYVKSDDPTQPCPDDPPTSLECLVVVTVSYDWQAITPVIGNIVGPITVSAISEMPIERVFP